MWPFDRPRIKEIMNLKEIFSLFFLELGFLIYYLHYSFEIFCVYLEDSSGGKTVSYFLVRP